MSIRRAVLACVVGTAECELEPADFCPAARAVGVSSMQQRTHLDAWRRPWCGRTSSS
ncbi:MAG: hypothetical protein JNM77_03960 [Pseudonocardia sp.]|nr:hypothetical protein [Pseudonocardia sp.]